MNAIQKAVLALTATIIVAADAHAGRWLSGDPIMQGSGFVQRDPLPRAELNLYGFVRNNPTGFVDAFGLYEIDVHYYLTYWLASKIPCFSDADARAIANGDQGVDENPETRPGLGTDEMQRFRNEFYHALYDHSLTGSVIGGNDKYLGTLWRGATGDHCDLKALGVYLHHLQDTFSHAGFDSSFIGHGNPLAFWQWHRPDKTEADYGKSAQMAAATWNALQEWVKNCRCLCYNAKVKGRELFVAPMGQQLSDFLKASGGPRTFQIGEEELRRKIGIIGVAPRDPLP